MSQDGLDMEYITISTGSREGNCHALRSSSGQILLLDLGVSPKVIKPAIGFNIKNIVGAVVTHCHGDHLKGAADIEKMGIRVIKAYEHREQAYILGEFSVIPFDLKHDVPCVGYMIIHKEMGKMLYITDTELVKYRFKDIDHVLIGVDYDKELLSKDHPAYEHIARGHMEVGTAIDFIKATDPKGMVILCHLSEDNTIARDVMWRFMTENIDNTIFAQKGLKIDLRR